MGGITRPGTAGWGVAQLVLVGDGSEAIVKSKNLAVGRLESGESQRRDSVVCPVQAVGDAQRDVFEREPHGERHGRYSRNDRQSVAWEHKARSVASVDGSRAAPRAGGGRGYAGSGRRRI